MRHQPALRVAGLSATAARARAANAAIAWKLGGAGPAPAARMGLVRLPVAAALLVERVTCAPSPAERGAELRPSPPVRPLRCQWEGAPVELSRSQGWPASDVAPVVLLLRAPAARTIEALAAARTEAFCIAVVRLHSCSSLFIGRSRGQLMRASRKERQGTGQPARQAAPTPCCSCVLLTLLGVSPTRSHAPATTRAD